MRNRKTAISVLGGVLAGTMLWAGAADAQAMRRPQPAGYAYVFGEYDYYSGSGSSLNGGGLGLGWRFARYFGIEGGGQYSTKSGVDIRNLYAQALFIMPISSSFDISLSAGGAYADASTTIGTTKFSTNASGYRAGIGANYWLSPNWALRFGFHRQNAGGVADDIAAGIAYRF